MLTNSLLVSLAGSHFPGLSVLVAVDLGPPVPLGYPVATSFTPQLPARLPSPAGQAVFLPSSTVPSKALDVWYLGLLWTTGGSGFSGLTSLMQSYLSSVEALFPSLRLDLSLY